MFFPRLRRQVKWMFVFLAVVFGVGFVVFNVGGSLPGGGLGDVLREVGQQAGPSEGEARDKIKDNPKDPQGYRELSTALQNKREIDAAIPPLRRYIELEPKDFGARRELAGLYLSVAGRYRDQTEAIQFEAQSVAAGTAFAPPSTTTLGRALGTDPVTGAVTELYNERLNAAFTRMQENYGLAIDVYRRLAGLQPTDASVQLDLATTAEAANDTATALAAYRRYLELSPGASDAPAIRARIEQLEQPAAPAPTGG